MPPPNWRVARSLDVLLGQLNAAAPNRNKVSDGAIGDAAHEAQGRSSDHNAWFVLGGQPLVTARDFTHDPTGGLDCDRLAAALIAAKDPRVKYLIWRGRLMDSRAVPGNGYRPWTWQPSSGHHQHLHLSVMDNASADDARPWSLPGLTNTPEEPMTLFTPAAKAAYDEAYRDIKTLLAVLVGPVGKDGLPAIQRHVNFIVEELTRRFGPRFAAIDAALAAIAADPDITPDQLDAAVNRAVAEHSPAAEDIAAAMASDVAAQVVALLPRDADGHLEVDVNEQHIAELVVAITGNRLSAIPAARTTEEN